MQNELTWELNTFQECLSSKEMSFSENNVCLFVHLPTFNVSLSHMHLFSINNHIFHSFSLVSFPVIVMCYKWPAIAHSQHGMGVSKLIMAQLYWY